MKFTWQQSFNILKLTSLTLTQRFTVICRYVNSAAWIISLSPQHREFIRLSMRCRRGAGSQSQIFIALWLNSNHFSLCDWQRNALCLIEGIDFPTPFGVHWRDTISGFGFQKKKKKKIITTHAESARGSHFLNKVQISFFKKQGPSVWPQTSFMYFSHPPVQTFSFSCTVAFILSHTTLSSCLRMLCSLCRMPFQLLVVNVPGDLDQVILLEEPPNSPS